MKLKLLFLSFVIGAIYPHLTSQSPVYVYFLNAGKTSYEQLLLNEKKILLDEKFLSQAKLQALQEIDYTSVKDESGLIVKIIPINIDTLNISENPPLNKISKMAFWLGKRMHEENNALHCFITLNDFYGLNALKLLSQMIDHNKFTITYIPNNHTKSYMTQLKTVLGWPLDGYNFLDEMFFKNIIHVNIILPGSYKNPHGIYFRKNSNVITRYKTYPVTCPNHARFCICKTNTKVLKTAQRALSEVLWQVKKLLLKRTTEKKDVQKETKARVS